MGYIPADAEWYLAEVVLEITVQNSRCNVVHRNLVLIHAQSPEEAYAKAVENGRNGEISYDNVSDQRVEIRFRGIASLDVIYEPLQDGAELAYQERLGVSESEIQQMIPPKERLNVFVPYEPPPKRDPDYGAKEIIEEALRMLDRDNPDTE